MAYTKDYFVDRTFEYEKNHGKFIHEFMYTEHEGRILGQCNVALNDLQKQLDIEVARAKAEEVRLDGKIDAESSRAKANESLLNKKIEDESKRAIAEEAVLDGNINTEVERAKSKENELSTRVSDCLPKAGGYMLDSSIIKWSHEPLNPNANPFNLGGLFWEGATDYASIKGEITGNNNLNLVIKLGDDNSNSIVIKNNNDQEVASINGYGVFTGTVDWSHVNNRPAIDKEALDNLNLNLTTLRQGYMALKARVDKLDGGAAR